MREASKGEPAKAERSSRHAASVEQPTSHPSQISLGLGRLLAYSANETMQILRDPVRLAFAFLGSALLMLVFGFGITTDVEHIRYAAFDLDQTAESRAYLEQFAATPRYFTETAPVRSAEDGLKRLQADDISLVIEMPPNFGRDLRKGLRPEVLAQVDGANTYRGKPSRSMFNMFRER